MANDQVLNQPPNTTSGFSGLTLEEPFIATSISPTTNKSPISRIPRKTVAAILGILVLVGAVFAGKTLVEQQQELRERASDAHCYSVDTNSGCTFQLNPTHCWRATTNNACRRLDGTVDNTFEIFSGPGSFDGQVCYTCDQNSLDNGTRKCSAGNLVETNPVCGTQPPPGETPPPPPPPTSGAGLCDNSCTSNANCASQSPSGAELICNTSIGMCVNRTCPNDTIPGNLCDCGASTQACGKPCGSGYPLCASGFSCRYVVGSKCTLGSTSNPTTRCIPDPPPTGWSLRKCVSRDTGNSYVLNSSGTNPTDSEIQAACAALTGTGTDETGTGGTETGVETDIGGGTGDTGSTGTDAGTGTGSTGTNGGGGTSTTGAETGDSGVGTGTGTGGGTGGGGQESGAGDSIADAGIGGGGSTGAGTTGTGTDTTTTTGDETEAVDWTGNGDGTITLESGGGSTDGDSWTGTGTGTITFEGTEAGSDATGTGTGTITWTGTGTADSGSGTGTFTGSGTGGVDGDGVWSGSVTGAVTWSKKANGATAWSVFSGKGIVLASKLDCTSTSCSKIQPYIPASGVGTPTILAIALAILAIIGALFLAF